jgi:hypothetical protein
VADGHVTAKLVQVKPPASGILRSILSRGGGERFQNHATGRCLRGAAPALLARFTDESAAGGLQLPAHNLQAFDYYLLIVISLS